MKKIVAVLLAVSILFLSNICICAENATNNGAEREASLECDDAKSAILMEAETGEIIFSKNKDMKLIPASVTKIMTLLLVSEAIADGRIALSDRVRISAAAASMGGSQVFLKEGEVMSVEELLKCTVIASANDAAVALAELVAGSEDAFVEKMNARASELGMENTFFENATGLDDTTEKHLTSAMDIAIMSRELIKHDIILKYSSIWQDTIRDGEFTLTNTNRLVRFYDGCNGLKTGSTSKAGYCMSATAKRGDMQLIAVIMGAETRDKRNEAARNLLDYGFANYEIYNSEEKAIENVKIKFGSKDSITIYEEQFSKLLPKSEVSKVEKIYTYPENLTAPINEFGEIGKIEYVIGGKSIGEAKIFAKESIEKLTFWQLFVHVLSNVFTPLD